ncbi:MAG: spore coat protein U domain-containing protein [Gammaproteobacteria bacterium]|nr:spore coat protein U domain-containing protein [Gammaproteobacteria bacterium]
MNMNKNLSLLALAVVSALACGTALATDASGTLTVNATLTTACEINTGGTIGFGTFAALASSGTKNANSGSTFKVACSQDAVTPKIYSATTREMLNGADAVPFTLSFVSSGGASLPSASPGTAIGITQDGTMKDVVLYGQLLPADYQGDKSLAYTVDLAMTVEY